MDSFERAAARFLRLSLGVAFLSAVADRLGIWGPPGSHWASWGDFAHFEAYTAQLNWFLPDGLIPAVAWVATLLEVALGVLLLTGWRLRQVAFASGALLLAFALAMTFSKGGIKSALNYSVFTAASAAFFLGSRSTGARPRQGG